jgi:hypothetical protein
MLPSVNNQFFVKVEGMRRGGKQKENEIKKEGTATLQPERLHTNYIFFLDIH